MDIQVGDRVTYRNITKNKIYIAIINDARDLTSKEWIEKQITDGYIEILKIERPKYEVVEEKKELLTEEEKEYLKNVIDTISEYSGKKIKNITFCQYTYHNEISFSTELFVVGTIAVRKEFYNLKSNQTYTLKELGLEE